MISIQKHLESVTGDVDALLKETVEELWNDLNPKNTDGSLADRSLIKSVSKYRPRLDEPAYIALFGADVVVRQVAYLDYIADADNLKHIITAAPSELDDVIAAANAKLEPGDLFKIVDDNIHPESFGLKLLSQVFKYDNYRSSSHCISRYKKLGFDGATCPYCNETPMKIVPKAEEHNHKDLMLFDIDHFYSKSSFPYLALSFYNHIPSCKTCNQIYKRASEFSLSTHIHPYHRCFDSHYHFQLNHGVLINQPPSTVKIRKKSTFEENLLTDLHIEARYQSNLDQARIARLVEILSSNSHILRGGEENDADRMRLKERLADFGAITDHKKILSQCYSKLQRDTIAMFDPHNLLQLQ